MEQILDLVIVGGGPVGLAAALKAQAHRYSFVLLESQDKLGGQLIELYPEKEIVDISGHESILAKNYIEWLVGQFNETSRKRLLTEQKVTAIIPASDLVTVTSEKMTFRAKAAIVATGLGVYMPRLLECHGAEGCRNIIYVLHRLDFLKGKRVAILGGGDAALDWARDISRQTPDVTLIHRRREFRGDINTIADIKTLKVMTPYVPARVEGTPGQAHELYLENVETKQIEKIEVDYIFVNYGHIPVSASFGLETSGPGIKVNETMETSAAHIYAVGDVASYEGKKRRIDAGMAELANLFMELERIIGRP